MRRITQYPLTNLLITSIVVAALSFATLYTGFATGTEDDPVPPMPTMTEEERAALFRPGDPWSGKGTFGIATTDARSFADYPVFWLGESFAGYNLQAIVRDKWTPDVPELAYEATDSVGLGYGQCVIPEGASACPIPILVQTEPVCLTRPDTVPRAVKASADLEVVRGGAQLLRFADGHLRIWNGNVSVYVSANADPALVDKIVDSLAGLNNAVLADQPLPAPDFSVCPPADPHLILDEVIPLD